jgi:chromosome segregation ATPase
MNSVQENKNELEAAVRYCESAISRAQATIESMEFRQQAVSKAWHEQTGREAALERELEERVAEVADLKQTVTFTEDRLMNATKEVEELKSELDELSKAYKDSTHEEITMKKAWREQRELVALRDDQIAMLERRLAKHTGEKVYPFKEGDLYYVFNQLDGTWIESVWDDESERIHDSPTIPSHPHRVYFTIDQKNVLDKFKPEQL